MGNGALKANSLTSPLTVTVTDYIMLGKLANLLHDVMYRLVEKLERTLGKLRLKQFQDLQGLAFRYNYLMN